MLAITILKELKYIHIKQIYEEKSIKLKIYKKHYGLLFL